MRKFEEIVHSLSIESSYSTILIKQDLIITSCLTDIDISHKHVLQILV